MKVILRKSLGIFLIFGSVTLLSACEDITVFLMSVQADNYFSAPSAQGSRFEELGNGLYAFQHGLDRSLIIDTSEGLVVVDSFNEKMARDLKQILNQKFPEKSVSHLIYSHHHLDHTRGGYELNPDKIIAHENTRWHFDHYPDTKMLKPTDYISGSQSLKFGDHEIELIDFEHAHAEHLYGFYFPEDKLLYGPDLALCQTFFPFGYPDYNHYGQIHALEEAAKLNFDRFISSHFNNGDKSCVTGTLGLFKDTRAIILDKFEQYGQPDEADGEWFRQVMGDTQKMIKRDYSDWHGYDEMGLAFMLRQLTGAVMGY
mgnify:FL=1